MRTQFLAGLMVAALAGSQVHAETQPTRSQRMAAAGKQAGEIASQPVRDVGISRVEIPPILIRARQDPYSLQGLKSCQTLAAEIKRLNAVLGPDFAVAGEVKESRAGMIAAAGGKTIVNSIIPFRGLVREVSGAAPAQRKLNLALDAGFARRGFLRGVHTARGCKTRF